MGKGRLLSHSLKISDVPYYTELLNRCVWFEPRSVVIRGTVDSGRLGECLKDCNLQRVGLSGCS